MPVNKPKLSKLELRQGESLTPHADKIISNVEKSQLISEGHPELSLHIDDKPLIEDDTKAELTVQQMEILTKTLNESFSNQNDMRAILFYTSNDTVCISLTSNTKKQSIEMIIKQDLNESYRTVNENDGSGDVWSEMVVPPEIPSLEDILTIPEKETK